MVEKKNAAIAVLCVVTILCLGLWTNEAQEASRLEGELLELEDDYEKLARVRTNLEENYSELRTEKEDLETEYLTLENDYLDLEVEKDTLEMEYFVIKSEYDSLEGNYSKLKGEYITLNSRYSTLYSSHHSLNEDYEELQTLLEEGKMIAESAEWITEDERLKVTSKLITSGTYWVTYTVKVTITNVGDEPIDKVCIFLFPYKNGKFGGTYFTYKSHTVENIYIGEIYSHDFTSLSEDMTSYKVLAVVG